MADFGVAVTDGDDFLFAVVVGDLVDVAVFFRFLHSVLHEKGCHFAYAG